MATCRQGVRTVSSRFSNWNCPKVSITVVSSRSSAFFSAAGDARNRGVAGQAQLTKNQTLEGHVKAISSLAWNQKFGKLTTADVNGTIIVWVDGPQNEFVQDMLNNRTKNRIADMKWNST